MGSNVELEWPESKAYSSRVNNCSHENSSLAAIRAKLSVEQLEQFKTSCFGHLLNIDKIQFSGQIVHGVVLRRVAGQGVKDLDGLSFLIGCDVAHFTRQDFCLITGLRFGEVPEVSSGEKEDDIYKLALVYFAELVVLGRDKHLNINLNYLTLVEDLDAFNRYPWGSVSFDKTQDSLFSAPTKYVKSFENEEGRGKGKSKVTGTSRRNEKGKKDKHGEVQRGGWSFKGFTYAFQIWVYELIPRMADLNYCKVVDPTAFPRILRWRTTIVVPEMIKLNNYFFQSKESVQLWALCPSEEEMRQPYWSWPQDCPAVVSAESIPSSCADLDELNKAVSLLRSELFQVKREKDVLELKVIRMEKMLDHCLGPHFEQKVRRDIALLKERTNRCVVSHLFKGYEEVDGMQWDEGPSNRNKGEENEEEDIEGGEGPNNRNEGEEKEEEGIERGEVASKRNEGEEKEDEGIEGGEGASKRNEGEENEEEGIEGGPIRPLLPATATDHPDPPDRTQNHRRHSADLARSSSRRLPPRTVGKTMVSDRFLRELWPAVSPSSGHQSGRVRHHALPARVTARGQQGGDYSTRCQFCTGFDPNSKVEFGSGRLNWYQSIRYPEEFEKFVELMVFKPTTAYPPVALRQLAILPHEFRGRLNRVVPVYSYDDIAPRVSGTLEPCGARIAAQAG
ncbi:unnamed protein product [Prunus armeniaca]